ncbi:MAG: hypothetical protein M3416_15390, partial [Acidobacteriota bacterium]|nr:hypothetical protein [Acidobacteriota bacterium]
MKRLLPLLILALLPAAASAQTLNKFSGSCEQGGVAAATSGVTSSTKHPKALPGATANIYQVGTVTPVSIFTDSAGSTPKATPFTCGASDASFTFYAAPGSVDLRLSGTGVSSPFTTTVGTVTPLGEVDPRVNARHNADSYASFAAAVAAVGSARATLEVSTAETVTTSLTVPATLALHFVGAGQLTISSGQTLTVVGALSSD